MTTGFRTEPGGSSSWMTTGFGAEPDGQVEGVGWGYSRKTHRMYSGHGIGSSSLRWICESAMTLTGQNQRLVLFAGEAVLGEFESDMAFETVELKIF